MSNPFESPRGLVSGSLIDRYEEADLIRLTWENRDIPYAGVKRAILSVFWIGWTLPTLFLTLLALLAAMTDDYDFVAAFLVFIALAFWLVEFLIIFAWTRFRSAWFGAEGVEISTRWIAVGKLGPDGAVPQRIRIHDVEQLILDSDSIWAPCVRLVWRKFDDRHDSEVGRFLTTSLSTELFDMIRRFIAEHRISIRITEYR